jgi:hypothetical protein
MFWQSPGTGFSSRFREYQIRALVMKLNRARWKTAACSPWVLVPTAL